MVYRVSNFGQFGTGATHHAHRFSRRTRGSFSVWNLSKAQRVTTAQRGEYPMHCPRLQWIPSKDFCPKRGNEPSEDTTASPSVSSISPENCHRAAVVPTHTGWLVQPGHVHLGFHTHLMDTTVNPPETRNSMAFPTCVQLCSYLATTACTSLAGPERPTVLSSEMNRMQFTTRDNE